MTPILAVDEINVFYGQFQALHGVSLAVSKGETVAIIGANGAGKTTLLNTIAGVLAPERGSVIYRGESITGKPPYALCRLGISMVPEGRRIFPSLTVRENLMIGAYADRSGPWDLTAVYSLFPILKERARALGTQLSGGEQQMLAIGRAMMGNPDLLLIDEISLGLAPLVVRELYRVVEEIGQAGTTVVLVEQDVTRALRAANRVYCLLEGRINLTGRSSELDTEQISHAYFGV